ncbi:MAG TPA: GNAT family N-acetyltransferase [Nocardioides sp.]|uniref:GNAT family N-acetyltransferase n=1 Tax=Nocardioides sp. TaxID=35761 RepID=UPI002F408B77
MDILEVDPELRLRPFAGDGDVDLAWPWYQDPETVALVDGPGSPTYARDRVAAMYESLTAQGEVYLIERRTPSGWEAGGDVTLAPDTLPIVLVPGLRGQGIGRRVMLRLVDRARVLGWSELRVRGVTPGNDASHRLFTGLGFVARPDGPPAYVFRLAPLGGRPRP